MAAKVWTGLGADNNWSTPLNWDLGAVPVTTDTVTFNVTSSKPCTIDALGTWVGTSFTITVDYTGSFTQNVALTTLSGTLSIGTSGATVTWTMNANLSATTIIVGTNGTLTRTAGAINAGISITTTGVVNLGADATIGNISTTSTSTVTSSGTLTLTNGTMTLTNGGTWDTSSMTRLNMFPAGVALVSLNFGTTVSSFSGVDIYITGSTNSSITGTNFTFNVVSLVKTGTGGFTGGTGTSIDIGANPTTTSNGFQINDELLVSGTWTHNATSGSTLAVHIQSTATVTGALTALNLNFSLTVEAGATWPSGVVLNLNLNTVGNTIIDASGRTFGTCTYTGSGNFSATIQTGTSITLAANQVSTNVGLLLINGTLNLLGNLALGGAFSLNTASTISGTAVVTITNGAFTASGTGTVAATIGINMAFTTGTGRTFGGAGKTWASLTRSGVGSGTLTITGTNTFVEGIFDTQGAIAHTIIFPNVTTTVGAFRVNGSTGKLVTLTRTGGAGTFTLTKTTGGDVNQVNYISVSNSTVDASPVWYAGANSTNGGGNTNWIFTAAPDADKLRKSAILV